MCFPIFVAMIAEARITAISVTQAITSSIRYGYRRWLDGNSSFQLTP
jgi:hypothetical protein